MNILAFETSCDETSVAVLSDEILKANLIYSQGFHTEYGGVVPELSSRAHIQKVLPLVREALKEAHMNISEVTHVAATAGPGLIGALMIGFTLAKGLCAARNIPLIPVNHIEGHIYSSFLCAQKPEYPFLCLVVSGGHTILFLIRGPLSFRLIGTTIDDAAGEAFDKVSKILGLGYPGGPRIQKCAENGNPLSVKFPIADVKNKYDFSFSGLKTSVLRYHQASCSDREHTAPEIIADIAASFQFTVVNTLCKKIEIALKEYKPKALAIVGGVAANKALRTASEELGQKYSVPVIIPQLQFCGDNAAMIAMRAKALIEAGERFGTEYDTSPSFRSAYLTV